MSTLKVAAINNPSASSGGLAISASGNVTGAGLDLITTQSFSAVSSVSVNNCFSATYDNYFVVISDLISSGGVECFVRLRASGSDNSTTNYALTRVVTDSAVSADRSVSANAWKPTGTDTACSTGLTLTVTNPQTATETSILTAAAQGGTGGSNYFVTGGGNFRATTQFDGFTFYPASGTMTGSVSVYGYKK